MTDVNMSGDDESIFCELWKLSSTVSGSLLRGLAGFNVLVWCSENQLPISEVGDVSRGDEQVLGTGVGVWKQ